METETNYWALHKWLFKAYWLGETAGRAGQMQRDIALCGMFGPGWKDEVERMEQEMLYEHLMELPEVKARLEKETRERLALMDASTVDQE